MRHSYYCKMTLFLCGVKFLFYLIFICSLDTSNPFCIPKYMCWSPRGRNLRPWHYTNHSHPGLTSCPWHVQVLLCVLSSRIFTVGVYGWMAVLIHLRQANGGQRNTCNSRDLWCRIQYSNGTTVIFLRCFVVRLFLTIFLYFFTPQSKH